MKLYDLPAYRKERPKIYGMSPGGHKNGYVEFDHIDGMYSYCVAFDGEGNKLGVCHLAAWTPLIKDGDSYRIAEEEQ